MSLSKLTYSNPIMFPTWVELNDEDLRAKFKEIYHCDPSDAKIPRCQNCDGQGYETCDLGCEHECPNCGGTGDGESAYDQFIMAEYREQIRLDKERIKRYAETL